MTSWTRRELLESSAVAAGALVIGVALPGCGPEERAAPPKGDLDANAWLRIDADGTIRMLCDRAEMGQGVLTALPTLIAEELGVDPEAVQVEFAPANEVYTNQLLGEQVTGASTSVRDAWTRLRRAGAEARERLRSAAAELWNVPVESCQVANGTVVHGERRARFGELAGTAAALPVGAEPALRAPSEWRLIGKPRPRLDTPSKVDGSARYGIDVRLPGQLYAALTQCPELGGRLKSFAASLALEQPGVVAAIETARGVLVIAEQFWQAVRARERVEYVWEPGANARLDDAAIRSGLELSSQRSGASARRDGNPEAVLATAARKHRAVYELPMLAHATLEPQNCTAELRDGACHVHVPTQVPHRVQQAAAAAAAIPVDRVHVHSTLIGGGFGRRLEADVVEAAVRGAAHTGRPVQVIWTREDDTTHDFYRPPARSTLEAGLDPDGTLTVWRHQIVSPSITARWAPAFVVDGVDPFAVEAAADFPYSVPNVGVEFVRHEIGIDVGYWRSVSHATNGFAIESFVDELAHLSGVDPYVFRRERLTDPRRRAVLERAAEAAGWGSAPDGRAQGLALLSGYESHLALVAELSVAESGLQVHRLVCAFDCGTVVNPAIVDAQAEGGLLFGLSAALFGEVNLERGVVQQRNFDRYRLLRFHEAPEIELHRIPSDAAPGGMGEPTVALVAPALANAIHAATGRRLRSLPFSRHDL